MQSIDHFEHVGVIYWFEPPIMVPKDVTIRSLGQLVGYAYMVPGFDGEVTTRFREIITNVIDNEIQRKSEAEFVLAKLQGALLGRNSVSME